MAETVWTPTTNTQLVTRGQQYSQIILPLARQERSMLYDKVYIKNDVQGKAFYQDQIGNWSMTEKTVANMQTPIADPNLSRTRIDINTYNDARVLDRTLDLQSFSDPLSMVNVCVSSAVGIKIDEVIYNALGATALRGENGATSVPLPAANTIPVDFETTGTNTGLTLAKIRRAAKMLDAKAIPTGDRTIVASTTAKEQLLGENKVQSADYNTIRALVNGEIDTFMGFKFVFLPDGIVNVDNTSDVATCYAFHKTAVCLGMLENMFLRVDERKDLSYSKQVYYEVSMGAGRLEEAKVIKILTDESVVV